jgi:hypothetical protein
LLLHSTNSSSNCKCTYYCNGPTTSLRQQRNSAPGTHIARCLRLSRTCRGRVTDANRVTARPCCVEISKLPCHGSRPPRLRSTWPPTRTPQSHCRNRPNTCSSTANKAPSSKTTWTSHHFVSGRELLDKLPAGVSRTTERGLFASRRGRRWAIR